MYRPDTIKIPICRYRDFLFFGKQAIERGTQVQTRVTLV